MRLFVKILLEFFEFLAGLFDGLLVRLFAGLQAMWKQNCVANVF